MGSSAQGKAVAVPFPAFYFLQRGVGEGVEWSLKVRLIEAARILRRESVDVFLSAVIHIFSKASGDTEHTGKLRFSCIVFPNKHTDRLAMIPGLIEQPCPEAPADNLAFFPRFWQLGYGGGGAPPGPGE